MSFVHSFSFTPPRRFDDPAEPWTDVRIDESSSESGPWTPLETIPLSPVDSNPGEPAERHVTTDEATLEEGWYRLVVLDAENDEGLMAPVHDTAAAGNDIRVMVPRVRRSVEGVGNDDTLTDDEMKDLIADALSEVILYTGDAFGKSIIVTERLDGIPVEYAVDPALTLPEETLVASQAALNHFFHVFQGQAGKISERIADEAQEWEWSRSAQLATSQFQLLVNERDKAIEAIEREEQIVLDGYTSFLGVRDAYTAALVEPWVAGYLACGQEDFRFGG